MNEPTMQTLARRLNRVERENRWWKRAGVVALTVITAVALMGQATRSKASEEASAGRAIVKRDGVPVYGRMSSTSQVVSTLKRGTVVTVELSLTTVEGAWCQLTIGEATGYVRCDDLEREPAPRWQEMPSQSTPPVAGRRPNSKRKRRQPAVSK